MPTALELTREQWQPYILARIGRENLVESENRERLLARHQAKTRPAVQ